MAGAHDPETLAFYEREAQAYAGQAGEPSRHLAPFLDRLRPAARILEQIPNPPSYTAIRTLLTILEKKVFHRSNLYSDAPMPYMQRLTWDGIALHAGHLPGYPASHGCIRLPAAVARQLFDLTEMGGTVQVIDDFLELPLYTPMPVAEPTPSPLLAAEMRGLGGDSYNVVTMAGDPPAQAERAQPASWVAGPYKEIVQPTGRGSR